MTSEQRYRDLIDEVFLGTISARGWDELRAHLSSCEACQKQYDRIVRAERKLAGASPSPEELARVESMVFARIAPKPVPLLDRLRWRPMLAVAAAAAAVLLFTVMPRDDDEFRARSGPSSRPASIRAFCLTKEDAVPLLSGGSCPLSAQLKLSIENRGDYRYAFAVGVQDGSPLWYEPRPPIEESAKAPLPSEGEVPFGGAVRLSVNHRPGSLRIFGIFSDEPIYAAEVEAAIRTGAEVLPLKRETAQRSVSIEVSP